MVDGPAGAGIVVVEVGRTTTTGGVEVDGPGGGVTDEEEVVPIWFVSVSRCVDWTGILNIPEDGNVA